MVETSSGSDGATQRLQCEAEGHPLPTVSWLSASRRLSGSQVHTSQLSPFRLVSSVPYREEDVFTCRVESRLGGAERRYPPGNALLISLTVCGLIVLLLLLSAGFVFYRRSRGELLLLIIISSVLQHSEYSEPVPRCTNTLLEVKVLLWKHYRT